MEVSVVIPAFNAAGSLPLCLESVRSQTMAPGEVIVVDDCSEDRTADIASEMGATLLSMGERSGPAVARNAGAESAKGDVIIFLDADVTIPSDLVSAVVEALSSDPACAAVQTVYSPVCPADDIVSRYQNFYYHYALVHVRQQNVAIFATWCAAVRREDFFSVGGFNTRIPEPTVEDEELGYSLVDAGKSILLAREIEVVHLAKYSLSQFTSRRFRMAKAQAKSGWRSVRNRLLKRYINLRDTGTHHSRWVVLSIILVLVSTLSLAAALVTSVLLKTNSSALLHLSWISLSISILCHTRFFMRSIMLFGWKILPGFAAMCVYDMAVLGCGIVRGSFLFVTGKHY